jgi:cell division protein FtsI/penicillin-binding protein 2
MIAQEPNEYSILRKRTEAVFLLFLGLVIILAMRLVYLQWFQAKGFAALADKMQGRTFEIDAARGRILDRNGHELATDVLAKAIAINPRLVSDPKATVDRLAALLKLDAKEREAMLERLRRAIERKTFYCQLKRGVERKLAESIAKEAKTDDRLDGLWLEDLPVRVNPCGADGIQLVGAVGADGHGIEAIELKFDKTLQGKNGSRHVRVSAMGEPIPRSETHRVDPVNGKDVKLTIDRDIQHFVEVELAKMAREQNPDSATAIVMDVRTGDILAMANWPAYHPDQKKIDPQARRNRAVTDLYEPGSTFKVITAAAALEYGVPTGVYCGGSRAAGKRTIRCAHGSAHGSVDLRKMVEKSCNVAAGTIAERIGPTRLFKFLEKMGLQEKTEIEFPGEEYGRLPDPQKRKDLWPTIRTVNVGFGQGVVVTPVQLVAAYAAIANDGVYNPPRLVLEAPGAKLPSRETREVMTSANAAALRSHMEAVVVSGTGTLAKIAGYSVAGKTGTAQIAKNGRYGNGYVASFVGFVPAGKPRLAILVSAWHPKKDQYGGVVAAPVFREIARQSVAYLRIPPDTPNDLRDGDPRRNREQASARRDLSND